MTDKNTQRFERPDKLISHRRVNSAIRVVELALTTALVTFVVFPIFYLFISSVTPTELLFQRGTTVVPSRITFDHYVALWTNTDFPTYMKNSLIIATGVVVLTVLLSTLAGYGLARAQFWGKKGMARGVLLTYMFPAILLAIPLYILFVRLGLLNSYIAIILGITGRTLPFGVWLMWQHFQSIPIAYEEAAWIDGASIKRTVFEIMIPMSFPAIAAVTIFSFAVAWNQFTIPRVIITDADMFPITLGIEAFTEATDIQWRFVLTSSVLTVLPGIILVTFLQEYFLRGLDLS